MDIGSEQKGAVTVLKPKGPLVHDDANELKKQLLEAVVNNLGRVVLDASDIPYVDSRGLEVLEEVSDELSQSGQALRLCGSTETLREVLNIADLAPMFEYYEDVNSALRSFL